MNTPETFLFAMVISFTVAGLALILRSAGARLRAVQTTARPRPFRPARR